MYRAMRGAYRAGWVLFIVLQLWVRNSCGLRIILTSPPAWETRRTVDDRLADFRNALDVIEDAREDRSDVSVDIFLISPEEAVVNYAKSRDFPSSNLHVTDIHGPHTILHQWAPVNGKKEKVVFLEDSSEISEMFLHWVERMWSTYSRRADIAALSLESIRVRSESKDHALPADSVYLFRRAEGLRNFSPEPETWKLFGEWMSKRKNGWYSFPNETLSGEGFLAHNNGGDLERAHWSLFFTDFMIDYSLLVLYPNLENGHALALRKTPILPKKLTDTPEYRTMLPREMMPMELPDNLLRLDENGLWLNHTYHGIFSKEIIDKIVDVAWKQDGIISFTVVNEAFLTTARSWLCNVDGGNFRPEGVLWVVNDEVSYKALKDIPGTDTVFLEEMSGGREGNEFGNPGYWMLMLERTMLLHEILERGVDVFNFETDQVWLEDPMPHIRQLLNEGADLIGTLNTRFEISGNLFYMKASLPLRRLWKEVSVRFHKAYHEAKLESKASNSWTYIQNDQSILTHLTLRDEKFQREYPTHFLTLDTQRFVDGRWYEKEKEVYNSERSKHPVLINNNFIIGVNEKISRAKKFGHWFYNEKNRSCDVKAVHLAMKKRK